ISSKPYFFNIFSINNQSFWNSENNTIFNLHLLPEKLNPTDNHYIGTSLEVDGKTDFSAVYSDSNNQENEVLWRELANNKIVNINGTLKPIIIMRPLAVINSAGQLDYLANVGDSIWLPNKDGTGLTEFIIGAAADSNPLTDAGFVFQGPGVTTGGFVSEEQAKDLQAFNPTSNLSYLNDNFHHVLIKSTATEARSDSNKELAQQIESWSNVVGTNSFRDQNGLYGFVASSVYSIFETQFDFQYKLFLFIQFFTSFGFVIGILGLLVVSFRSVAVRKREIGMMRSIGLKKYQIVLAIVMELSIMGIIGLVIGMIVGNTLAYGLTWINSQGLDQFLIPWDLITFYTLLTLGGALLSAIIPGQSAAKIPPSEALRYVG
ncbi:MAG: ABC transporter permease, partial [Candidatus Thorarchaeota archaeon]